MLKEPTFDFPLTEGRHWVYLEEGQYVAYMDHDAVLDLLFGLYDLAKEKLIGEELDIWTHCGDGPHCPGTPIGFCEINLVDASTQVQVGKTILRWVDAGIGGPDGLIFEKQYRLDYFVTLEEFHEAYETLTAFLADPEEGENRQEITIFETLVIRLVTEGALPCQ